MNTLYTLGYSGLDPAHLEAFIAGLDSPTLMDVRLKAAARDARWRKGALVTRFGALYVHEPRLGNLLYKEAHGVQLNDAEAGIAFLAEALAASDVIVMCVCREWQTCHRAEVVGELLKVRPDTLVVHLDLAGFQPKDEPTPGPVQQN